MWRIFKKMCSTRKLYFFYFNRLKFSSDIHESYQEDEWISKTFKNHSNLMYSFEIDFEEESNFDSVLHDVMNPHFIKRKECIKNCWESRVSRVGQFFLASSVPYLNVFIFWLIAPLKPRVTPNLLHKWDLMK